MSHWRCLRLLNHKNDRKRIKPMETLKTGPPKPNWKGTSLMAETCLPLAAAALAATSAAAISYCFGANLVAAVSYCCDVFCASVAAGTHCFKASVVAGSSGS